MAYSLLVFRHVKVRNYTYAAFNYLIGQNIGWRLVSTNFIGSHLGERGLLRPK